MKFEQFDTSSTVEEGTIQRNKNVEIILKTIEFFDKENKRSEVNNKSYGQS